jgi:hypothetical protein
MNTERLFQTILLDYATEQLKLEHKLETMINSDLDIDVKITNIKTLLAKITEVESCVAKFNSMVQLDNNNNNKEEKN